MLIYKDGLLTNSVTLEDIMLGKVTIAYTQLDVNQMGNLAWVDYTLTQPSVRSEAEFKITDSLSFKSNDSAMVIWGDGSGAGGGSSRYTSGGSTPGQNGGAGNDTLVGSAQSDLIFGDGAGGGGGRHPYNGNPTGNSREGLGGGGDDNIDAGDGDDIIFGDGFSGELGVAGYGGGGIYGSGVPYPGSVGGGGGANNSGGSTAPTLGPARSPYGVNAGGWGVQNGNINNYVAETDSGANGTTTFNNSGSVNTTVMGVRTQFLSGTGHLFSQNIGQGNDTILGGASDDYIMAGGGNDTIIGGHGNDIMYGRGGSGWFNGQNLTNVNDNDLFIWKRGDADGSAIDVIRDFQIWDGAQGDRLDISQLLEGFNKTTSDISQWVISIRNNTTQVGALGWDAGKTGTTITIDVDGNDPGTNGQTIFLTNVNGISTDINTLISNGTIIV